ncbi:hypothetical protein E2493_16665 [Sphingomonas parva]|uniref:Mobilization protein n=1 Tax=Sphingomonas parva TaxID=2555898 RepID=A0A4Y8ZMC1_9SPHN|nr:hypothetical protein [Sphingomonas parva]TFI57141.1 hypothetical protein E2493_16665 [Sphingomonas parva]
MSCPGEKATASKTRTLSVRLLNAHADRVRAEAATKHVTISAVISHALFDRQRPTYLALAALGRLIAITEAARREPNIDPAVLAELKVLVRELRAAAWAEITNDH